MLPNQGLGTMDGIGWPSCGPPAPAPIEHPPIDELASVIYLTCVCEPIQKQLALHLETGTQHNWAELAEQFKVEASYINWLRCNPTKEGYTSRLFEHCRTRVTIADLIAGLEAIGNLAALSVVYQNYNKIKRSYESDISQMRVGLKSFSRQERTVRDDNPFSPPHPTSLQNSYSLPPSDTNFELQSVDIAYNNSEQCNVGFACFNSNQDQGQRAEVLLTYATSDGVELCQQLSRQLRENKFGVRVDTSNSRLMTRTDWFSWAERQLKEVDFVIVLISPGYKSAVDSSPSSCSALSGRKHNSNNDLVRIIYQMMLQEFLDCHSVNRRFVPLRLPTSQYSHVPFWLKDTTIYRWPADFTRLLAFLSKAKPVDSH